MQLKKSARRLLREKPSSSNEEDVNANVSDSRTIRYIEKAPAVDIEKIGDLTPVQDFEAMMSRRDSPDWVRTAMKEMSDKILDLLTDFCNGDNHLKAVECIAALRNGCIREQVCPFSRPFFNLFACVYMLSQDCQFLLLPTSIMRIWCICLMI